YLPRLAHSLEHGSRKRSQRREGLYWRGKVSVLGQAIEVAVVVDQRDAVMLGDRRDQVVEGWDAEMLVRFPQLHLEVGRSTFGTLGDPQQRKGGGIDSRQISVGSGLEQQWRAGGDEAASDPVGDLGSARVVERVAPEAPERAGVEQPPSFGQG
ncbi:MAG: hypothetical protein QOJ29_2353, partial [Thermoleophilaceae bacterium]|nr:hypothetical protein [Thermoleophilaceae bacterium]